MWSTLPYLVKVQICFALLWIVYRLFLQRDGRFARSRAYLLLSVPVSFLIPLLSIPVLPASQSAAVPTVPVAAVAEAPVRIQPVSAAEDASLFAEAAPEALFASPAPVPTSTRVATAASPGTQVPASFRAAAVSAFAALVPAGWPGLLYMWLFWCGIAGSLLLLLYYLGHTLRWVRLIREGNVSRMLDDVRVVYSPAVSSPCSLFNCIFVNRRDLGENEFRELMAHELCHIRLRHSWDRLLAVVVTLFCWWNPFVWLWHRSLCEVHEYQADDAVLRCGFDAEQYVMLMVSSVAGARTTLASGFSYSLVRKRLQMLSRGASRRAGLRMLLVVPALAVLLALFSFTERPVAACSPEQAPAELSDQLLSAFGYSADAAPAAAQAQTAAEEGPTRSSGDDTVPADDAEQTAAVQPGAASADASGASGYGVPASGGESPAGGRVSSKGDDVVIMVDGKVDPRGANALGELDPADVERITVGTKDSPVVMVTTKRRLVDYPEQPDVIRKREGDFGIREFLDASAENPQARAGSRAGTSAPVKTDGWDEAIETAAAIERSAQTPASSTLDLTANALGAASDAVSAAGGTPASIQIAASRDVLQAKADVVRAKEDIVKAKADIERAKAEVVAEAARLRKQLDDDTARWAGTFAGQYAGDSRETSKSHVQDNMIRLTRFAGRNISGVSASSGFRVEVRESSSTSVEIVMPAEWQQYLTCELTSDGVVQLGLDTRRLSGSKGLRINKGQLTAVVSLPKFSQLKCSIGAVIRCTGNFKGGAVQLRASSGGMVDGLSLKASEALIDASSGGVIRNVAVTAPKAAVEISAGAVVKGVSLDAAALTCHVSSGAVATLEHTGKSATLSTGSGGTIRISGATQTLSLHKSTSGGHINTDGYRVSGS